MIKRTHVHDAVPHDTHDHTFNKRGILHKHEFTCRIWSLSTVMWRRLAHGACLPIDLPIVAQRLAVKCAAGLDQASLRSPGSTTGSHISGVPATATAALEDLKFMGVTPPQGPRASLP